MFQKAEDIGLVKPAEDAVVAQLLFESSPSPLDSEPKIQLGNWDKGKHSLPDLTIVRVERSLVKALQVIRDIRCMSLQWNIGQIKAQCQHCVSQEP